MSTYFVSRHPGAVEWANRNGIQSEQISHFDPSVVLDGGTVIGTLPINLVADVNAAGGRYLHLSINLPANARGKELSADDMDRYGARIEQFSAARVR